MSHIRHSFNGTSQNTQTYQYDALNRLLYAVKHSGAVPADTGRTWYQTFQYDNFSNRGLMIDAYDAYTSTT